jgi:magnesium chelatase family protein
MWDRIDIHVEVPKVKHDKLTDQEGTAEKSEIIRARVQKARDLQTQRFKGTNIFSNAEMKTPEIKKFCKLNLDGENLIKQAVIKMSLSARSYFRILKVARTIADLDALENITPKHLGEALQLRKRE